MAELDDTELLAMFDAGLNITHIAEELGMAPATVRKVLKEHGRDTNRKAHEVDTVDVLQMYTQGVPTADILSKHNISYNTLYSIMRKAGIEPRTIKTQYVANERKQRAIELYIAGVPIWSIKMETGISQPTLHDALHQQGIPLRRPRLL